MLERSVPAAHEKTPLYWLLGGKFAEVKYYSTRRPVAPGTFLRPDGNKILEIVNFDERKYCPEAGCDCWGYIEYENPLTEKQAVDCELVRERILDFRQRYMACAGTSFLRTFATAGELNEWFDAQLVEDRHFCRLYDRVRMVHILGCRYMWLKPEERWTDDPQSSFPSASLLSREEPWN